MLKILHKGFQVNAPLDKTGFNGDLAHDAALASVVALVAGRLVAMGAAGVKLADAAEGVADEPIGFVIEDAAGYFMENKPALASGIVPVAFGNQAVITDQIDTTETFAPGDKLYLGAGAKKGLITKTVTAAGTARVIGIALSAASAASPELTMVAF